MSQKRDKKLNFERTWICNEKFTILNKLLLSFSQNRKRQKQKKN